MQRSKENILASTNIINSFQNKLIIWSKFVTAGNVEVFTSIVDRNSDNILQFISNNLDTFFACLFKYFPSISIDENDWVRTTFVKFLTFEGQINLGEEEKLASVASDLTLMLKHFELDLE
ncbi:hypothetical protein RF11_14117 [Thelohanellus kitauei]|uniref:Uncharacterized protein n=1 Tax=Thelohanellus kitauei TaxID=669202 RepID=A0A0C2MRA0_THEKT|nr:hypothetical protein RF11_14117 [Thelohanellus kitauei]